MVVIITPRFLVQLDIFCGKKQGTESIGAGFEHTFSKNKHCFFHL